MTAGAAALAAACAVLAWRELAVSPRRGGGALAQMAELEESAAHQPAQEVRLTFSPGAAEAIAPLRGKTSASAKEKYFNAIASRYRLAGFRINRRSPEMSRAIIEDMEAHRQWLRREGEMLTQGVTLAGIETNAVALSTPYGICLLKLTRRENANAGHATERTGASATQAEPIFDFGEGAAARLEGTEESPGTWRIARDDLMAYYDEVRRRPERLEAVFDSLAPIWFVDEADGAQKIEGYRVEPCGEERFFAAMGLSEGDVVREVNGIKMTNRYAAEELIRRFAAGDLEFAHIKMERGGEEIIQSYFLK